MIATVGRYNHPDHSMQQQEHYLIENDGALDDDEQSLSQAQLSDGDEGDDLYDTLDGDSDHVDSKANKTNMSSMSMFMSSLVGLHSDDGSFCLQVDNAKPRDLPPPPPPPSSSSDSSSVVSITRRQKGLSRWESTPSNHSKRGGTSSTTPTVKNPSRPRAMRPWRPPNSSTSNNSSGSNSSGGSSNRKADAPIVRPQRIDSNRSLKSNLSLSSNAKLPQRIDSNRSLKQELSIRDLSLAPSSQVSSATSMAASSSRCYDHSMDLRVLLEEEEFHQQQKQQQQQEKDENSGVYLNIPAAESRHSLWSTCSTMTTSFISSRSIMSHYSVSSVRNMDVSGSSSHTVYGYNANNNTLGSEEGEGQEHQEASPYCRKGSRELYFQSNACEQPVRRPVRAPSERSMFNSALSTSTNQGLRRPVRAPSERSMYSSAMPVDNNHESSEASAAKTAPTTAAVITATKTKKNIHKNMDAMDSLLPPLNLYESQNSTSIFSFRLIRSLSEQTLETATQSRKQQQQQDNDNINGGNSPNKDAFGRYLKRTMSDSLLFRSQDFTENSSTSFAVLY